MSTSIWSEDYLDSEDFDDAEAELDLDSEGYDDEASRSELRRRSVLRRAQRERNGRGHPSRQVTVAPTRPTPQQAVTAIRNLDLDNKVQDESIRRALATQNRRLTRSEYVTVAAAVVTQVIDSLTPNLEPIPKAALRALPTIAMIKAPTKGISFAGYLGRNPAIPGLVALAAITFAGEQRTKRSKISQVTIIAPPQFTVNVATVVTARAIDVKGNPYPATSLTVIPTEGVTVAGMLVTVTRPGWVELLVDLDGRRESLYVEGIAPTTPTATAAPSPKV